MYWLYDRYNMYAFSLVNSINKTMKTLSFYKFSWLFLCNSAPWNRWSWRMGFAFLRQPSSGRNWWWLTAARKRVQFFFLPLLLPTGGSLFLAQRWGVAAPTCWNSWERSRQSAVLLHTRSTEDRWLQSDGQNWMNFLRMNSAAFFTLNS